MEAVFIVGSAILGWFLASGRGKAQWVRLIDIFLYGPFLMYVAFQPYLLRETLPKFLMLFLGSTTITYNLRNYLGNS